MELEKAENIIDTMYQNKMKERETKIGNTLHIDMTKDIEFTELEEASVRVLREELKLKKELDKKDEILNNIKNELETELNFCEAENTEKHNKCTVQIQFYKNLLKKYFEEEEKVEEEI